MSYMSHGGSRGGKEFSSGELSSQVRPDQLGSSVQPPVPFQPRQPSQRRQALTGERLPIPMLQGEVTGDPTPNSSSPMESKQDKLNYIQLDQLRKLAEQKQQIAEVAAFRSDDPIEKERQERRAQGFNNASQRLNKKFNEKYNEAHGSSSGQKEVDLETANKILDTVIGTHESQITPETPLDTVSGYSYEQIRQAAAICVTNLLRRHHAQPDSPGTVDLIKQTPDGRLKLTMFRRIGTGAGSNLPPEYELLQLNLQDKGKYIFEATIPLTDRESIAIGGFVGFHDWRTGTHASPVLDKNLDSFRKQWLGLRVLNANVRDWDTQPGVIKPEQLANPPVPPAK